MKRFSLVVLCLLAGIVSFAQKDPLAEVKLSVYKKDKDFAKSKESIDKVLADPKNAGNAEAYYWKGYIYNYLAKDEKLKGLCTDCRMDAFNAMKKYVELDPTLKELKADSNALFYDMYYAYYDMGAKAYNNKDYEAAITNFKNTLAVENYIYKKGLIGPGNAKVNAFDTAIVLYTGVAASQLKKDDVMLEYYQQLIDAGVNEPRYMEIYQTVAEYYRDKKDNNMWMESINKGKKVFGDQDYWYQAEIEMIPKTADKAVVFAKYEDQVNARPKSFFITYNYAVELFKYVYTGDKSPDLEQKRARLNDVLKLSVAADTSNEANVLMAKHLDYWSGDLADAATAIKGVKPEDVKKRNDLKAESAKKVEESRQHAETAIAVYAAKAKLTGRQKSNYKDVLDIMSRYYQSKGDAKKAQEFKDRKAGVDKA